MKIQIIREPPVDNRHGLVRGRVMEVLKTHRHRLHEGYWVMSDMGKRVLVLLDEARVLVP